MQVTNLEQLIGYDLLDAAGTRIGRVDGVWVDDATDQLEFVGVETGDLDRAHVVPATQAEIGASTIQVPFTAEQISDAPRFSIERELTALNEGAIYSHFGIERSTAGS